MRAGHWRAGLLRAACAVAFVFSLGATGAWGVPEYVPDHILVKFLPGGSMSPYEFFSRINARWNWVEEKDVTAPGIPGSGKSGVTKSARSALCIADLDSIQQLAIDLAIMPGAGISNVEILQSIEDTEFGFQSLKYSGDRTK